MGSATAVSLTGCQQACEMAQPDCDAIVYNPTLQACFLKQRPSTQLCQVRHQCSDVSNSSDTVTRALALDSVASGK